MAQADDLDQLPADVRTSARIYPNGEISWSIMASRNAINSLAGAGFVILGLDIRRHDESEHIWETAWSDFSATDQYRHCQEDDGTTLIEASRLHALAALDREDTAQFGDWILISW